MIFERTPSIIEDTSVTIAAYSTDIVNCQIGKTYLVVSAFVGINVSQSIVSGGTTLFAHTVKVGSNTNGFGIVFQATATTVRLQYSRDEYTYSVARIE